MALRHHTRLQMWDAFSCFKSTPSACAFLQLVLFYSLFYHTMHLWSPHRPSTLTLHPCTSAEDAPAQTSRRSIPDHRTAARANAPPGRERDLEVSLYQFYYLTSSPQKSWILAFSAASAHPQSWAPALSSYQPSAGSKFSIYPCYEGHVERTTGGFKR